MQRQFDRRKFLPLAKLIHGNVIELCFALRAAPDILERQQNIGPIRAERGAAVTANPVDRVDLSGGRLRLIV